MALENATAGLETGFTTGGTTLPVTRVLLQSTQGRAHAALGHVAAAAAALEAAAKDAHRYELWLYEAFALRDLKLLVLDQMGHGEHGSRRLGAALRLLKGPARCLTPMLKDLDTEELMSLTLTRRLSRSPDTRMCTLKSKMPFRVATLRRANCVLSSRA